MPKKENNRYLTNGGHFGIFVFQQEAVVQRHDQKRFRKDECGIGQLAVSERGFNSHLFFVVI